MLELVRPDLPARWDAARQLVEEYATPLKLDLSFQDFHHEIEDLARQYGCPSPILRPHTQKGLTLAQRLTTLRTMRHVFRIVATRRSALAARRDLLLEYVALRHQLGVLVRSDLRFRPSDRLFWLCLRRWWPRWKDALILVQPATVARWDRKGFVDGGAQGVGQEGRASIHKFRP